MTPERFTEERVTEKSGHLANPMIKEIRKAEISAPFSARSSRNEDQINKVIAEGWECFYDALTIEQRSFAKLGADQYADIQNQHILLAIQYLMNRFAIRREKGEKLIQTKQ